MHEGIGRAFETFLGTEHLETVFRASTKASWGGGGYSIELRRDGSYRMLDNSQIGNRDASPGLILPIPTLDENEWDGTDKGEILIDRALLLLCESYLAIP